MKHECGKSNPSSNFLAHFDKNVQKKSGGREKRMDGGEEKQGKGENNERRSEL